MRYNRTELLRRVELTRRRLVDDAVNDRRREQAKWDALYDEWRTRYAPDLVAALRALIDRVEGGEVLSYGGLNDLPAYRFRGDTRRPDDLDPDQLPHPGWLEELERVLASLTDDDVSANALDKAGVIRHVRRLVRVPSGNVD